MPYSYVVRVMKRGLGELVETHEFENRQQLALFFESASFAPDLYYQVTRTS